jgi:hypothetical protein
MECVCCGSAAVTERPERTARGFRRFRCRDCGKQCNERSGTLLNHAHYPSDVIALVVLWRLRYRLDHGKDSCAIVTHPPQDEVTRDGRSAEARVCTKPFRFCPV